MKKLFSVVLLLIAGLICVGTMDAKTTKRTSKARTSKTTSTNSAATAATWNEDIPSAAILFSFFDGVQSKYQNEFKEHGYSIKGDVYTKSGVCTIEFIVGRDASVQVTIKDSTLRKKLLNDVKAYIKAKRFRSYDVSEMGNNIMIEYLR